MSDCWIVSKFNFRFNFSLLLHFILLTLLKERHTYSILPHVQLLTIKRPKFGNGPLVRHPLSELMKNHISAWAEVSDLVQKGERLYIFFCTNKKINIWGSPYTLYDLQQLGPCMSKLGFEKCHTRGAETTPSLI